MLTAWRSGVAATGGKLVVATGAACLLVGGAGAYAAWLVSGHASGEVKTATARALVVTATSLAADLYPGATVPASLTVQNPNAFPVTVTQVAFSGVTPSAGTCTADNLDVRTATGLTEVVPANGSKSLQVAGAFTLKSTATDACQGVTFTVTATVNGSS